MAEQWIAAAAARDIIGGVSGSNGVTRALCIRAHEGLIATKAKLLVYGDRRAADTLIPAAFWWAEGEAALEQNWTIGDFSTWIDQSIECRALGVTFPLSGILDMLPAEQHAEVTRRLSVAGQANWVSFANASQLALQLPGVVSACAYIVEQGRLGLLQGRAVLAERFPNPHSKTSVWEEREWSIPTVVWGGIAQAGDKYQEWNLGRLCAGVMVRGEPGWLQLRGVHILAEPLREAVSSPATPSPDPTPKPKAGGRPAQPWWDDLWCAVWGLIHQGDFQPKTQADVEKAMLTWAAMNDHDVSEAAVRPKARKLFQTYSGEATNFLDP